MVRSLLLSLGLVAMGPQAAPVPPPPPLTDSTAPPPAAPAPGPITLEQIDLQALPVATVRFVVERPGQQRYLGGLLARDLAVSLNDARLDSLTLTSHQNGGQPVAIVLVLDLGGNLGASPQAARLALREVADRMRSGDRVGLIGVNDSVRAMLPLTPVGPGRAPARIPRVAELASPLWAGVDSGVAMVARARTASRYVVVVTDRAVQDTTGMPEQSAARAAMAGVTLFSVAIGSAADHDALRRLTGATGGRRFRAGSVAGLRNVYAAVTDRIANEYRLTFTIPDSLVGRAVSLRLKVATAFEGWNPDSLEVTSSFLATKATGTTPAPDRGLPWTEPLFLVLVGLAALEGVLLLVLLVGLLTRMPRRARAVLLGLALVLALLMLVLALGLAGVEDPLSPERIAPLT